MSPGRAENHPSAEKATASAVLNSAELAGERSDAMDYTTAAWKGHAVGRGRSKAVSTDVADTIEGLMPALMDIFCSSDEVVRFEPVGPEDEKRRSRKRITSTTFHATEPWLPDAVFLHQDALLQKTASSKSGGGQGQRAPGTYYDQPDDAFAMLAMQILQSNGDMQIIEHTQKADDQGQVVRMT